MPVTLHEADQVNQVMQEPVNAGEVTSSHNAYCKYQEVIAQKQLGLG
jgi:hypothetical protein